MHRLFAPEPLEKATQFEIVGVALVLRSEGAVLQPYVAAFLQHPAVLILQEIAGLSFVSPGMKILVSNFKNLNEGLRQPAGFLMRQSCCNSQEKGRPL
jgi:hypothetical protein